MLAVVKKERMERVHFHLDFLICFNGHFHKAVENSFSLTTATKSIVLLSIAQNAYLVRVWCHQKGEEAYREATQFF